MKTLNDMLQKATQLSKREMKNVKGGQHFVRCNQNSAEGVYVADCSRASVAQACGDNFTTNTVCIETK